MDAKLTGMKAVKGGTYGGIGVLVEYLCAKYLGMDDLPGGVITTACASAGHALHNLIQQYRGKA
jgi:hypothetical protein